jgi:hypothetical protein
MKHVKHAFEALIKITLATYVCNICNIQINALATYVWKNS